MTQEKPSDGRFATLFDENGNTPCAFPDACYVCVLFTTQRADETRDEWLHRITSSASRFGSWSSYSHDH